MTVEQLGIAELVDVCAREQHRAMALFERLGGWVSTTGDPALQRRFAIAAHRHAWHAQLWAERTPTIPITARPAVDDPGDADAIDAIDADADREAAYGRAVDAMLADLTTLRSRIDPDLDPATVRVIELVTADLRTSAVTPSTAP